MSKLPIVRDMPSIAFSLVLHAIALLALGLWYLPAVVDFMPWGVMGELCPLVIP